MAVELQDADLDFSSIGKIIGALINPIAGDPGSPAEGEIWYNQTSDRLKLQTGSGAVELATMADVTGGAITGALWDAQSVVTAVVDDTPSATVLAEATVLGRLSGGNIGAVTHAQLLAALEALGIDASTLGGQNSAFHLSRANHTGTQTSATISDFNTAADARAQAIVDATIDGAPGALDTLNELAAALGDDADFANTVNTALAARTQKYVADFGDAAAQTFVINHALGTTDVVVSVRRNSDNAVINVQVVHTDANNITIDTNSVPALNAYRVVVVG